MKMRETCKANELENNSDVGQKLSLFPGNMGLTHGKRLT